MYSGTTIRRGSGKIVGVHQKIDRVARRHIKKRLPKNTYFPTIKEILHFEGSNGPDGLKRKSPSADQPWHFISPNNPNDGGLIVEINDRIHNLTIALKDRNDVKAAFEAAWLSHVIVDGLTPAHHYPLGDKIAELWGKPHDERNSIKDKNLIRGVNIRDTILKNWEYWGIRGVFTTHGMFEFGVASAIASDNFKESTIIARDITRLEKQGFEQLYKKSLQKIDSLKMYEELGENGWTSRLAKQTTLILVPEMIKMVTLAWSQAVLSAKQS